ncbi:hypothetical protein ACVBGC_01885 [Burkholderia stagnalis]
MGVEMRLRMGVPIDPLMTVAVDAVDDARSGAPERSSTSRG